MEWEVPTLSDGLEAARRRIAPHLRPTPLYGYAALNELLGAEVFVKHENHQPVGAFKVRGGVNLISQLNADERERGVSPVAVLQAGRDFWHPTPSASAKGPILTRLDVDATRDEATFNGGDLDEYQPNTQRGHAVAIVGYTPDRFIVRNSCGTG